MFRGWATTCLILLDPNQSGFKAGHSTETALLVVTEALHVAKSQSLSSVLLLLDLSAAFDTVDHRILLSSLVEMGISGSALTWFESYLADWSYQVAWRGSLSSPHTLSTGVPQGMVLGPVLFSPYTKSLDSVISAHGFSYHCYANDTQLFLSFSPSETQVPARISACLADISAWMSTHYLKLNLGKMELLFLPAKGSPMFDASITEGRLHSVSVPVCQESWSDPGKPAVLLKPRCSDYSDLPILPPQHPEDPTVPHPRGHTSPGPGPGLVFQKSSRSSPTSPLYSPLCTGSPSQHASD
ncbi:hypothetical protein AAFF_G00098180 [Aldrovandia affinis]|uniref:Reverse transcriptase domain-containing protein n=1 Tax=Aldrovandia affinis TaxID=143900 RepID=A0AAD7WBS6_9TELE|nr:hypothetical protein AAFF_G00098180 [Aldrovandia affinis]